MAKVDPCRKIRDYIISTLPLNKNGSLYLDPINKELTKYEIDVKNHLIKHRYIISPNAKEEFWRISDEGKSMKDYKGHYKYQRLLSKERWRKEHPLIVELRTPIIVAIVAGGISILVSLFLSQLEHQSQYLIDKRQDSVLRDLGDSLKMLQKHK